MQRWGGFLCIKDRGQGSSWLRAGIKPWCLRRLWHPSPSLVPHVTELGVPMQALVLSWPGEHVLSPRHGKHRWERPRFLAGRTNKELERLEGKSHPGLSPWGIPPPRHSVGDAGLSIIPVGSSLVPQVHPQPWGHNVGVLGVALNVGGPPTPQGTAPAQGAMGSPQLLHPPGRFGVCSPKSGGSLGTPHLSCPLPGSRSAWCSRIIYSGAPGNPLAANGSPWFLSWAAGG